MHRPTVLVVTRRTPRKNHHVNYVSERHLELLVKLRLLPVMVPVVEGTISCLPQYMEGMGGLLLVEGEDIEPQRYKAQKANLTYLEKTHPLKDEIEIRLIQHILEQKLPMLGICRGSQLLNIVNGGTLYGDVLKEKQAEKKNAKKSPVKHIEENQAHYDSYRHPVTLVPHTPLHRWFGLDRIQVNSYHHQGVRKLASRFKPMAHADDGLIEAFYDPKLPFLVGLQFHPERMLHDYVGNWHIWQAFGSAIHQQYDQTNPSPSLK